MSTTNSSMAEYTYTELVEFARFGDQEAVAELYTRTYSGAYHTARTLIRDEDAAQDILQDAYVKAFRNLDKLKMPEQFPSWTRKIVANSAKNWLKRKKPVLFTEMENEDGDMEVEFRDDRTANLPDAALDQKETVRLMSRILDSLPEDQRLVIGMFYYQSMSVNQIARTLGCSEGTVKSRLNYGRKKVEFQVRELEKEGVRLYSLAPIPFLLWLMRCRSTASVRPDPAILAAVTAKPVPQPVNPAAKAAAETVTRTAAKTAAKKASRGIAAKIAAGVLAMTVVGGGAAAVLSGRNAAPAAETEPPIAIQAEVLPQETTAPETHPEHEAYQSVLEQYALACGMSDEAFMAAYESGDEQSFHYDHRSLFYYHMYHDHDYYYAFYDIDRNGTDELLVGIRFTESEGADVSIVDVYGFGGTEAIELVDEPTLGDRSSLSLFADGSMYLYGGNGNMTAPTEIWYQLEGTELRESASGSLDGAPATDIVWQPLRGIPAIRDARMNAFDRVIEQYRAAWNVSGQDWLVNEEYYHSLYPDVTMGDAMLFHNSEYDRLMYALRDLDGNGAEELIIAIGYRNSDPYLYHLYTFDGKKAVQAVDSGFLLLGDGTIVIEDFFGNVGKVLRLSGNGWTLRDDTGSGIAVGSAAYDRDFADQGGKVKELDWQLLSDFGQKSQRMLTSIEAVKADIRTACNLYDYAENKAAYDAEFSHLGQGVMARLQDRDDGVHTLHVFGVNYDIDDDGQLEYCVGIGLTPQRGITPFVAYDETESGLTALCGTALQPYLTQCVPDGLPVNWMDWEYIVE